MAPRTKNAAATDPEVERAERQRDRVAAQYDDGIVGIQALEAAEARLSNSIADAERRAERADAIARERDCVASVDAERAARWEAIAPAVAERMVEREVLAAELERLLADLVANVQAFNALPSLTPMLTDAPLPPRKEVHPLASAFTEAIRPVATSLGIPHVPLPPPAFRAPLTEIIAAVHGPIWEVIEPGSKP